MKTSYSDLYISNPVVVASIISSSVSPRPAVRTTINGYYKNESTLSLNFTVEFIFKSDETWNSWKCLDANSDLTPMTVYIRPQINSTTYGDAIKSFTIPTDKVHGASIPKSDEYKTSTIFSTLVDIPISSLIPSNGDSQGFLLATEERYIDIANNNSTSTFYLGQIGRFTTRAGVINTPTGSSSKKVQFILGKIGGDTSNAVVTGGYNSAVMPILSSSILKQIPSGKYPTSIASDTKTSWLTSYLKSDGTLNGVGFSGNEVEDLVGWSNSQTVSLSQLTISHAYKPNIWLDTFYRYSSNSSIKDEIGTKCFVQVESSYSGSFSIQISDGLNSKKVSSGSGLKQFNYSFSQPAIRPDIPVQIYAEFTNSDGVSAILSLTKPAEDYISPIINKILCVRTDSTGNQQDEGEYVTVSIDWTVSALGSQTQPTKLDVVARKRSNDTQVASNSFTSFTVLSTSVANRASGNTTFTFSAGQIFNTDEQYTIRATLTDAIDDTVVTDLVTDAFYALDILGDKLLYNKTTDTSVDSSKTYYVRTGVGTVQAPYEYWKVTSPVSSHLSYYYEANGIQPGHGMGIGRTAFREALDIGIETYITGHNMHVEKETTEDTGFWAKRTNVNTEIALLVGSSGRSGIWSPTQNRWLLYTSGSNVYLAGPCWLDGVLKRVITSGISYIDGAKGTSGLHIQKNTGAIWYPMVSTTTAGGGGWAIGNYADERLQFVYGTKANVDASKNETFNINLPAGRSGTIALLEDFKEQITLQSTTTNSIAYNSVGAKITFKNSDGSQNGQLIYTDYDVVDSGASLTFVTDQPQSWLRAPYMRAINMLYAGSAVLYGNLTAQFNEIDASQANNGVSAVQYPTTFNITDKAGRILTRKEGVIETNGNISAYWYVRNYNTSGTQVGQKGIRITMNKSGTLTYTFDDPANARSALGTLASTFANSYYGMGTPAGNFTDWIRTTSSGIIPYQSGGASSLGTSSWPFTNGYFNNLYIGGTSVLTNVALGDRAVTLSRDTLNDGAGRVFQISGTTSNAGSAVNGHSIVYSFRNTGILCWDGTTSKTLWNSANAITDITVSGTTLTATRMGGGTFTRTLQDKDTNTAKGTFATQTYTGSTPAISASGYGSVTTAVSTAAGGTFTGRHNMYTNHQSVIGIVGVNGAIAYCWNNTATARAAGYATITLTNTHLTVST